MLNCIFVVEALLKDWSVPSLYTLNIGLLINTPSALSPALPMVIVFVASVPRGEIVDTFNRAHYTPINLYPKAYVSLNPSSKTVVLPTV